LWVCPPPPTWRGTALTLATATGWRTDILIISTQRPHGASLDTSRNRGTSQHFGACRNARPRPHEGVQCSRATHLGTCCWERVSRRTRDRRGRRHPLHDKGFPCSTKGNSWNPRPHHPPPNTTGQKAWEQTDPALRPLHQWDALTYTDASRRRVKLPCGRAVIRLGAADTPHDGHRVNSRPRTQP
jgi:hypothetical protein